MNLFQVSLEALISRPGLYPVGENRYFLTADESRRSGNAVSRDLEEVKGWLRQGKVVHHVDSRCGFCGGPTPCLRD